MIVETLTKSESLKFPGERQAVKLLQDRYRFSDTEAIQWALKNGLTSPGLVTVAEVSPSLRCPEACPGCPDSSLGLAEAIKKRLAPKIEERATLGVMQQRIKFLHDLGVKHFMFIGGTIDGLPELSDLIGFTQALSDDVRVSWFTDMIAEIDQKTGNQSFLLRKHLEDGWIQKVATHVSMDYNYQGNLVNGETNLPPKAGRIKKFEIDTEFSRRFKSQYGAVGAKRLIDANVRRVVINTTVSPRNIDEVLKIYKQVEGLQQYARNIGSQTEVFWTFSPWIWRPHQARGDSPHESPVSLGLSMENMSAVNEAFKQILEDTYRCEKEGKPRILANSSGYTNFMVDPAYRELVVNQEVPYGGGKPEVYNIDPTGKTTCDPMFNGPELTEVHSIFGYRDRVPEESKNPFRKFHDSNMGPWFSNIVPT